MASGALIAESLKVGSSLDVPVHVSRIERVALDDLSSSQREAGIPSTWTLLHFTVADPDVEALAEALAEALDEYGWYVDFATDVETFVIFSGRVFRYPTQDRSARREVEEYAMSVGVPRHQLDRP